MPGQPSKSQSKRATKRSKGIHGAGGKGVALTEIQKILLGGGLLRNAHKRKAHEE